MFHTLCFSLTVTPVEASKPFGKPKMQSLCSQSAEAIANNEDLLTQFLVCLPARSLLRFKCVSKQWYSLISNPKFCDSHTLQNPNPTISGFFFSNTSVSDFYSISLPSNENPSGCPSVPLNFVTNPRGFSIKQSCNGLLLCLEYSIIDIYYVVNPTTSRFITLPPTSSASAYNIWGAALAFDPSESLHYKVIFVRITEEFSDTDSLQVEVDIYSSETLSWRFDKPTYLDSFCFNFSDGVYSNGAMHWINSQGALLRYDIDEDCFVVVHSLTSRFNKVVYMYFGESRGHLNLVESYPPDFTQLVVLEMERDYSGWSVKYNVDLCPIIAAFPEMVCEDFGPTVFYFYALVIVLVAREENEEDNSSLLLHIPRNLISYNLRDKTFNKLCDLTPGLQVGWKTYHYMETLACV